ncbi:hypothetical protein XH83_18100 [Bradyrhizobium sp. CCBAU 53351]|nr:hypothetical protein XH83_18100 [Bradyrhizobium sp. CCBAU 53351]
MIYVAVNVIAAVIGLYLLRTVGKSLITETDQLNRSIYEVLLAGIGSMTFLRSSIFKIRLNDTEVAVGPAALLDVLLLAADRGVDRRRGKARAQEVSEAMANVSFEKAITTLPPFCFALMQNLSKDAQKEFSDQVKEIQQNPSIDPHVKSLLLGLALMNIVGVNVVRTATKQLANFISYPRDAEAPKPDGRRFNELLTEVTRSWTGTGSTGAEAASAGATDEATARPARAGTAARPVAPQPPRGGLTGAGASVEEAKSAPPSGEPIVVHTEDDAEPEGTEPQSDAADDKRSPPPAG